MKNIVLFSDGTGNSAAMLQKTNVWRLYQALDLSGPSPNKPEQIAYYDNGVGTSSFKPMALAGGAFGWGLKRNVIDLYTFLCRHYKEEDQIYCFGFSRGAFTIRVLSGLIASQGLVQAEPETKLRRLATDAFRAYRRQYKTKLRTLVRKPRDFVQSKWPKIKVDQPSQRPLNTKIPPIKFLGLWDTVDAYGLPIDELTRAWKWVFPLAIPNREPSENIERICHALALDDERHSFHPVLLNEKGLNSQAAHYTKDERISQVWFAGVHSNVGGGYPDDSLAMVPLQWMMCEAVAAGLVLKEDECKKVEEKASSRGKLYDSRHGLSGVYRYQPRKLELLINDQEDLDNSVVIDRPKIHESVFERIKSGTDGYAPFTLPEQYAVVTAQREIVDLPPANQEAGIVENQRQAMDRTKSQEEIWNLVWLRRLVYFISVGLVFWLALFPLAHSATGACEEGIFCFLLPAVKGVGFLLPDFLDYWFLAYESHPGKFIGLAIVLAIMLCLGGRLQGRAREEMGALWRPISEKQGVLAEKRASDSRRFIYCLRTHDWYQKIFKFIRELVLPLGAGLLVVWLVLAGLSQGIFAMMSSAGLACEPTTSLSDLSPGRQWQGDFPNASLCWASSVELKQGKAYRITLSIDSNQSWMDGSIISGINGLGHEELSPFMFFGVPFRRVVGDTWFKPIARIGSRGSDEYPLDPVAYSIPGVPGRELVSEITARRSGELFLFVNDMVLSGPKVWQKFYNNNKGTARVTVELIPLTKLVHLKE